MLVVRCVSVVVCVGWWCGVYFVRSVSSVLFVARCLMVDVCWLCLIVCCILLDVCCCVGCGALCDVRVACCVLVVACCLVLVVWYSHFDVRLSLFVARCFVAC